MNYLNDKKNMIAILVVIGVLTAAAMGMLLSVPGVLRSILRTLLDILIMAPMIATSLIQ
jgi:hypothetical protein